MFIPGALHGIEASFLADTSLRKLRTAVSKVVWSDRQPLANTGAVLSVLDGPFGCDLAFCVVWFWFRMIRRYLAYRPSDVPRMYRLLDSVVEGCPGHGLAHSLVESAAEIRFQWGSRQLERLVLPVLSNLAGPIQHFELRYLRPGGVRFWLIYVLGRASEEGPWLDFDGTLQLLSSDHVRERDKALPRRVLVGVVWNGFLLKKVKGQHVLCRFCGGADGDGHLFWDCTFFLWLKS